MRGECQGCGENATLNREGGYCGACDPEPGTAGWDITIGDVTGAEGASYRGARLVHRGDEDVCELLTQPEHADLEDAAMLQVAREALAASPRRWFVNEYLTWKEWGGPEEGGWFFDAGSYIECRGVFEDRRSAVEKLTFLGEYLKQRHADQHPPGDVRCSGWSELRIEPYPGEDYPAVRPHYE